MKQSWKRLAGFAVAAIAPLSLGISPATAKPGLQGSYVGLPVDTEQLLQQPERYLVPGNLPGMVLDEVLKQGVVPGLGPSRPTDTGALFQGRYDLPQSPVSVRGTVFLGNGSQAVLPSVSYDLGVANNVNVYAGAGYALVNQQVQQTTPLGDRNGVVLSTGVEAEVVKGVVVYGDAKWLGARPTGTPSRMRYQLGVGYRF